MRRAFRRPGRPERIALLAAFLFAAATCARAEPGAREPWRTYEAESMRTDGAVLRSGGTPGTLETESSGLGCVRLASGQQVEFTAAAPANALVVRYCLPDAPNGGGLQGSLEIRVNGRRRRTVAVTSHYAWLYGTYPFSNDPKEGNPRNVYDESRVPNLPLAPGDVIRLTWSPGSAPWCVLDLVDLEQIAPPLVPPPASLAIGKFGAQGDGIADDTGALRRAVSAASAAGGGTVWVPAGDYLITGDIVIPSGVTVQGAGMWHTRFVGDPQLYANSARRVRFLLKGSRNGLSDFAILGRLDYRNDQEPNDGVVGAGCSDSTVRRLWIEHTKTGIWVYNGVHLEIEGCRLRDLIADGINLCVGTSDTVVENCSTRGTGDDCFAVWPAASDQGFVGRPQPGRNVIRHCTGRLPFLANGGALYGGEGNRIEDCAFVDVTAGCGLLVSTTFPTDDPVRGIDNNFSGTTEISRCRLLRCGGWDHAWGYRGSLQICLDRKSISGLRIRGVTIQDSLSDGITLVAPGAAGGHGTLSNAVLENTRVTWPSLPPHRALWIRKDAKGQLRCRDDAIDRAANESPTFDLSG